MTTQIQSEKSLRVALAGLGTIGGATLRLLQEKSDSFEQHCGRPIKIVAVAAKGRTRARAFDLTGIDFEDDALKLAFREDVDVVCELIGGGSGIAHTLCEESLRQGKSVVTANKALLAVHGMTLAALAEKHGGQLMFEAAVGGGIPIIKTIRESLMGNAVTSVQGILNGTCNYILTRMRDDKGGFDVALKEAQRLGYAEADPSADVDGHDSAHKLCILAALAFGCEPDFSAVSIEGLRQLTSVDFDCARDLGYSIKMLGTASFHEAGLAQRVCPCLVSHASPLASVDDVLNAIQLEGDAVGSLVLVGAGAGGKATASAVVGDLVDLARGHKVNPWGCPVSDLKKAKILPEKERRGRWYIRLHVTDQAGVLADIAAILRDEAISIESLLQQGRGPKTSVPVIIVTHETNEATLHAALAKIAKLDSVWEEPFCLRIDTNKD
ncbi:MAG: homoserine dehydrogenase [Alphaproteobacteria bacterium]|nr:homoserine dehydrogenase [Alphaproteobacteria bacterium]